jgi:hypothetical protein
MLALWGSTASAADSITLSQAKIGNLFLTTETVQIPLQTTGDHVTWTATDFFGNTTNGPTIAVTNGQATITPNLGLLGYFDLQITALRNGSAVASAETTFAIVAPASVATMSDSPFGICTHFAQGWGTDIMQVLTRGGIAQFRDEQYWQTVEPNLTSPATYNFSSFQGYMSAAASAGLSPLMELDFANGNYDGGNTPDDSTGYTGYANYGKALLSQYGSQVENVEIWNEYNGTYCTGPALNDRPGYYTSMLQTAYAAIKAARPDVTVVGGAAVPAPIPWFQALFADGAQDSMDVIAVHPYRAIPEGVENNMAQLQALSASYNHGNGAKPIWATECGADDYINPGRQDMARYLVRLMTLMLSAGVQRMYWYLAYDFSGDLEGILHPPNDPFGNYAPYSPFPAYSNLIQQLYHATYIGRDTTDARTRMYHFKRSGNDVRVVWSTTGTAQLVLSTNAPLTYIDIMGNSSQLTPTNGVIALTADTTPYYIIGNVTGVRELGRDVIVADSDRDFTSTQGTTNGTWSYLNGYVVPGTAYNPSPSDPSMLTQMTYAVTNFGYEYNSYYAFAEIDQDGTLPGAREGYATVYPVWTVRRWLSSASATAHFSGTIIRASPLGDGTGAQIYVDGNLVYSTMLGGNGVGGVTVNFDFNAPIQIGSKVDFIATPGPGTDVDYDYIDYQVQISVPQPTPTTFASWQNQNFTAAQVINPTIAGETAAPAGDGVSNLFKYAANVSPLTISSTALPIGGVQNVASSNYLTLSYRLSPSITDLTITPQVNTGNLSTWAAGGVQLGSPTSNSDGTQTYTFRDTVPITSSTPKRFMRLQITGP